METKMWFLLEPRTSDLFIENDRANTTDSLYANPNPDL